MLGLGRDIAMFRPTVDAFLRGDPEAILFVEFAEDDWAENLRRLKRLGELIGDLGLAWDNSGAKWGGVVEVLDPKLQAGITEVRTAGLNIMMSMKEAGQSRLLRRGLRRAAARISPITRRGSPQIFAKARHARHLVRACRRRLPACAPGAQPAARQGRARRCAPSPRKPSPWCATTRARIPASTATASCARNSTRRCSAPELVHAFEEVKDRFDPQSAVQSRQDRRAPKFDDRSCFATRPTITSMRLKTALDWSAYPGAGGGFQGAVEMCNNNGACRKLDGGVMCPSYRVTRNEQRRHARPRQHAAAGASPASSAPDALASDEMAETLKLCVSCKACRRECPTGVDMARMKIEVLPRGAKKHGYRCETG